MCPTWDRFCWFDLLFSDIFWMKTKFINSPYLDFVNALPNWNSRCALPGTDYVGLICCFQIFSEWKTKFINSTYLDFFNALPNWNSRCALPGTDFVSLICSVLEWEKIHQLYILRFFHFLTQLDFKVCPTGDWFCKFDLLNSRIENDSSIINT